ncbi:Splicing factor 3B subunit 2 [Heterocephalus glaber]|uniref:Splicing factor 3B subunit 2 n=1 Tax=Heterocephalus glaber TaxID=10181 RepID=G5AVP7_HETGA|nr:Splicing factor 3B subunit 2 [Heterocephalus glaber]
MPQPPMGLPPLQPPPPPPSPPPGLGLGFPMAHPPNLGPLPPLHVGEPVALSEEELLELQEECAKQQVDHSLKEHELLEQQKQAAVLLEQEQQQELAKMGNPVPWPSQDMGQIGVLTPLGPRVAAPIEYVTEEPEIYEPNFIFFKRIFEAFKLTDVKKEKEKEPEKLDKTENSAAPKKKDFEEEHKDSDNDSSDVDETGKLLYGYVFGTNAAEFQTKTEEKEIDRSPWGELKSSDKESSKEEEEEENDEDKPDETGFITPADSGLITPGEFLSVLAGMETPELIELRKTKIEEVMDGSETPQLFTVLPEKRTATIGGAMMGSTHIYNMSTVMSQKGPAPELQGVKVALPPKELELDPMAMTQKYEEHV